MSEGVKHDFVVFSDDWGRHPSSCQHLFRRIIREHRVLWVNTIGLRAPKADRFTLFRGVEKLREWSKPLKEVTPNLHVLSPAMLPVFGEGKVAEWNKRMTVRAIRRAMRDLGMCKPIVWATVPTAVDFVGQLNESAAAYYITDDYSLWPGGDAEKIARADRELTQKSDVVFACSEPLAASHRALNERVVLLPHAVDFEHFSSPKSEPVELKDIPHPRACFFGLIYEKIDLESLYELATAKPELQLVMIGPVKTDVSKLAGLSNVHFLGAVAYEKLPAYLQAMDLFVVPYVPDEEIKASGPLKIRECLAVGRPTVVRSLPDLESLGDVVYLYGERGEFVRTVEKAMNEQRLGGEDRVRSETWEKRVETIMTTLAEVGAAKAAVELPEDDVFISGSAGNWSSYLEQKFEATVFHDPRWGEVMADAYGNRPFYLTAVRGEKIVGVLQLVEQKSAVFGSHLTSLPYFDSAGILAEDEQAVRSLLAAAGRVRQDRKVRWAELRQTAVIDTELPTRTDKVTMQLDLPADSETLWNGLDAKVRNQVRKARSAGFEMVIGGMELLDEFMGVYVRNMRDLGSPPHHRRFFQSILDHFPEAVKIFIVRSGSAAVAGSFTLIDRGVMRVPWAASDWRLKKDCPNMLLYWSMLEAACAEKLKTFDFGRSTREAGTWRFKKQWGSLEVPLYWQYLLGGSETLPELRPDSGKYRLMVSAWRKLPVSLAGKLGPWIIRKLS
jgi:FemAB-related protein (PEP-CTERM system-associated)